jgi:hypothetical protein
MTNRERAEAFLIDRRPAGLSDAGALAKVIEVAVREAVQAERERRAAEIKRLQDALNIDATGLAAALNECRKVARGYWWVTEGRGPYEWDDDEYRLEMGRMIKRVCEVAEIGLGASGRLVMAVLRDGAIPSPAPPPAAALPPGMRDPSPVERQAIAELMADPDRYKSSVEPAVPAVAPTRSEMTPEQVRNALLAGVEKAKQVEPAGEVPVCGACTRDGSVYVQVATMDACQCGTMTYNRRPARPASVTMSGDANCPWCVGGYVAETGVMCRTCRGTGGG